MAKTPKLTVAASKSDDAEAAGGRAMVKRKDFLDRVAARSGAKKTDVRAVSDAVLGVIADALKAGEDLNLPPIGKIKMVKEKQTGARQTLTVRIVMGGGTDDSEGLAEDDADS